MRHGDGEPRDGAPGALRDAPPRRNARYKRQRRTRESRRLNGIHVSPFAMDACAVTRYLVFAIILLWIAYVMRAALSLGGDPAPRVE